MEAKLGKAAPMHDFGKVGSVVDDFDALTMDRCYRAALRDERALEMLRAERGRAFDPAIVDTFIVHLPALLQPRDLINQRRPSFPDRVEGVAARTTVPAASAACSTTPTGPPWPAAPAT